MSNTRQIFAIAIAVTLILSVTVYQDVQAGKNKKSSLISGSGNGAPSSGGIISGQNNGGNGLPSSGGSVSANGVDGTDGANSNGGSATTGNCADGSGANGADCC